MGNLDTARDLYKMGIGKVQDTNPKLEVCLFQCIEVAVSSADVPLQLLKGLYAKVVAQSDPEFVKQNTTSKRRDPFQTLPLEIAAIVLSSLTFPDVWSAASRTTLPLLTYTFVVIA